MPEIPVQLDERLRRLEVAVGTLVMWMAKAADSPISMADAVKLLGMIGPLPAKPETLEERR